MLTATVRPLISASPLLASGALRVLDLPYHPPPDAYVSIQKDDGETVPSGGASLVSVSEKPTTSLTRFRNLSELAEMDVVNGALELCAQEVHVKTVLGFAGLGILVGFGGPILGVITLIISVLRSGPVRVSGYPEPLLNLHKAISDCCDKIGELISEYTIAPLPELEQRYQELVAKLSELIADTEYHNKKFSRYQRNYYKNIFDRLRVPFIMFDRPSTTLEELGGICLYAVRALWRDSKRKELAAKKFLGDLPKRLDQI